MPLFAHFEGRADQGERRRSTRRMLTLGVGTTGDAVTISDISLTGMLLKTSSAMLVGASFEVELPNIGSVRSVVVWNSGEFYGCEFDEPISAATVSAALLQSAPASEQAGPTGKPDPVAELKALNSEVEQLSSKLVRAIERLGRT
jgi:hypothetical protein